MKKTSLFCLALGLSAALCACGSAATETTPVPETDSAVAATESNDTTGTENAAAETESVVTEDAVPTSYLTGLECTEEEREQRPMAVMLNNIKAGTPQAGIGQASVIYEAPMEGADVTRLMPLFENWQNLDTIGYIRSSRDYFVYSALEFDAIYAHFGQATPYVGDLLNSDLVDNISGAVAGIDRPASKAFMHPTMYIQPVKHWQKRQRNLNTA